MLSEIVKSADESKIDKNWYSPQSTPLPPTKFLFGPHQKTMPPTPLPHSINVFMLKPSNTIIFRYSHYSCTIFVLISHSFDTQVMLILILFDAQYSQNAVVSFEKGLNCQNHSSSCSHHPVKKIPPPPLSKISNW